MVEDAPPPPPMWHGVVAGICSTMVSRVVTFPPDTIKARLQVQGSEARLTTLGVTREILYHEGLPGFYRGFWVLLASVIPANICYFGGYELGKRHAPQGHGVLTDIMAAGIAQGIGGVVYCPIDVVKQHLQTATLLQRDHELAKRHHGHHDGRPPAAAVATGGPATGAESSGRAAPAGRGAALAATVRVPAAPPVSAAAGSPTLHFDHPPPSAASGAHARPSSAPPRAVKPPRPMSVSQAVRGITARYGLRGLYAGFWTMNALWMPWNMLYIPAYEKMKRAWCDAILREREAANVEWDRRSRRSTPGGDRDRGDERAGGGEGGGSIAPAFETSPFLSTVLGTHRGWGPGTERVSGPPTAAILLSDGDPPGPTAAAPHQLHDVLPPWAFPACSALSSSGASLLTHPIDVVKTRLQVLSTSSVGTKRDREHNLTPLRVARQLYAQEGLAGFSRGLGARIATMALGTSVSWFVYEEVKAWMAQRERQE